MALGPYLQSLTFEDAVSRTLSNWTSQVVVFIGENGVGKSRLLEHLAKLAIHQRTPVTIISNTPFDRFSGMKGRNVRKCLARNGMRLPERNIKRAISAASAKGGRKLARISQVLTHCGYEEAFGVQIVRGSAETLRWSTEDRLSESKKLKVMPLAESLVAGYVPSDDIQWVNTADEAFTRRAESLIPEILKYEADLKRIGVVGDIRLFLKKDGHVVQLRNASSGELSLISSMLFLATNATRESLVLIDEPENSLHPQWQQQFLNLTLQFLGYEGARVMIATHSPIIVSSTATRGLGEQPETIVLRNRESISTSLLTEGGSAGGIDGILTEAFDTVTPESHYLSVAVTELLERLTEGSASLNRVTGAIDELISASSDHRQQEALRSAKLLAADIGRPRADSQ